MKPIHPASGRVFSILGRKQFDFYRITACLPEFIMPLSGLLEQKTMRCLTGAESAAQQFLLDTEKAFLSIHPAIKCEVKEVKGKGVWFPFSSSFLFCLANLSNSSILVFFIASSSPYFSNLSCSFW